MTERNYRNDAEKKSCKSINEIAEEFSRALLADAAAHSSEAYQASVSRSSKAEKDARVERAFTHYEEARGEHG